MDHVILVIHLILTLALIALILLQRSEGGGFGLGTGGGLGNFASPQSTANALTKATTFIAIGFFATSLILAIIAARSGGEKSIIDQLPASEVAAPEMSGKPAPAPLSGSPQVPISNATGDASKPPISSPTPSIKQDPSVPLTK